MERAGRINAIPLTPNRLLRRVKAAADDSSKLM